MATVCAECWEGRCGWQRLEGVQRLKLMGLSGTLEWVVRELILKEQGQLMCLSRGVLLGDRAACKEE